MDVMGWDDMAGIGTGQYEMEIAAWGISTRIDKSIGASLLKFHVNSQAFS